MFKGVNPQLDSYSAFYDNQKLSKTILDELIRKEGVSDLYICGIATDVCVGRFHVKQKSVPVNMEIKRRLKKIVLHFQDYKELFKKWLIVLWASENVVCLLYIFKIEDDIKHLKVFVVIQKVRIRTDLLISPSMLKI